MSSHLNDIIDERSCMKIFCKKEVKKSMINIEDIQKELNLIHSENQCLKKDIDTKREMEEKFFRKIVNYINLLPADKKENTIIQLRKMFLKSMFNLNLVYEYYMEGTKLDGYPNRGNIFEFIFVHGSSYKLKRSNVYSIHKEVVMTCPWDDERTKKVFPTIANEGFKNEIENSYNYYLKELGFIINQNGNHSITSMGLMETGNFIVKWEKSFDLSLLKYKRSYLNYKVSYNSKRYDLKCNNIFEALVLELSKILFELNEYANNEREDELKRAPIIPISGRDLSLIIDLLKEEARKRGEKLVEVENCLIANYNHLGIEISNSLLRDGFLNEKSNVEIYLKITNFYDVEGLNALIKNFQKFHYQYETKISLQVIGSEITIQSNSLEIVRN